MAAATNYRIVAFESVTSGREGTRDRNDLVADGPARQLNGATRPRSREFHPVRIRVEARPEWVEHGGDCLARRIETPFERGERGALSKRSSDADAGKSGNSQAPIVTGRR